MLSFAFVKFAFVAFDIVFIKLEYFPIVPIFILKIIFLFFKNTVKILKFRYTYYLFRNN